MDNGPGTSIPSDDAEPLKEVKVKIPLEYHVKLHSMKVLTGQQISDTITEALRSYFLKRDGPQKLEHAEVSELLDGVTG
jgi:hypothetical protein